LQQTTNTFTDVHFTLLLAAENIDSDVKPQLVNTRLVCACY